MVETAMEVLQRVAAEGQETGVYPLFWQRLCPLPTDCRFPSAALDVFQPEAYGRATYLVEKERTGV